MIESRALGATLKNLFPLLPQLGLLQCTEILDLWHMEWLLSGELGGLVDMETTPDELLATFNAVLTGTLVLQLRARPQHTRQIWPVGRSTAALGLGPRLTVDDEVLARLAADGRSEADLGREMHLSVHTIHRKLERLRALLGLRNRIELAAWCGAQGLYRPVPLPVADRERRALDGEGFGEVLEQVLEQTPY